MGRKDKDKNVKSEAKKKRKPLEPPSGSGLR